MTLSSLIDDFLQNLKVEQQASKLTIRNYHHWLKEFLQFSRLAKRAGDIDPQDIDLRLIRKYKLHLAKKTLKKKTQNYFLIAIRSFLRYLATVGVKSLEVDSVGLARWEKSSPHILNDLQLRRLLLAPDMSKKQGLRDRAILETLYATGAKVSELVNLNRDDVSSVWVEKYLRARKDAFKPLFIRFQGKVDPDDSGEAMRLSPRSIERIVEKYVKKVNLAVKATPEILRRSRD